jgi:hypothetical protein
LVASIGEVAVIKILCILVGIFALAFVDMHGSQKAIPSRAPVATGLRQAADASAPAARLSVPSTWKNS